MSWSQLDELKGRYARLRSELENAYAATVWESSDINRITDEIVRVEYALASLQFETTTEEGLHV